MKPGRPAVLGERGCDYGGEGGCVVAIYSNSIAI